MIEIKNTEIGFDASLFTIHEMDFEQGKMQILMGKNGIGKSALLNTLSGLISPIEGSLSFDEKLLSDYSQKHLS